MAAIAVILHIQNVRRASCERMRIAACKIWQNKNVDIMIKRMILALCVLMCSMSASAEILTPVKWKSEVKMNDANSGVMIFSATIDDGWHMYAMNLPKGGPEPLSINWETTDGVTLAGELTPSVAPHEQVDMVFHMKLGWGRQMSLSRRISLSTSPPIR